MKLIERPLYIERLKALKNTPDIKIITGIRRCGKSKLLQAFMDYLRTEEPSCNIICIDFANLQFEELKEYHALNTYVEQHTRNDCTNYLMIDEVQMCDNFEISINSLHSTGKYDIYLTGSNAFLLSSDLATLFTGRHMEIHVLPFSFSEYCSYHSPQDLEAAFDSYVVGGGLSGSYVYEELRDREVYVREVYDTILTRDLVGKYNLSDAQPLYNLSEYMMDNVSNITSPNNISHILRANDMPLSHVSVGRYLKYLCSAFLLYKVDRYDIRGKKYLELNSKYYLSDTGIRYAVLGRRNMDWGRIYENIVYLELLRRGYIVYIGKLYRKEVDFVAMRGSEKMYIQVSDDISGGETFKREVSPLLSVGDAYPKLIIARTRHEEYDYSGVHIYNLASWLLQRQSL